MRVVYQYGKSHISGGVRRSYRKRPCPEMTSPEAALNGSDVTGRGPDRKCPLPVAPPHSSRDVAFSVLIYYSHRLKKGY
jgi:hypothetical protein